MASPESTTAADAVAAALADAGVTRLFGVPGGGSSLDLIAAAHRRGLPFALARHETAAVIMAASTAELTGRPGAALVTRGPGVANAANGVAHASLDRAPVLLVADGFTGAERAFADHQWFDHAAMLAPVTKAAAKAVEPGAAAGPMAAALLAKSLSAPRGPVLLELSGAAARAPAALPPPPGAAPASAAPDAAALDGARKLLAGAERAVLVAGLEAAAPEACAALRRLLEALGCPGFVTYKAKGVVPDAHPLFAGVFTGGAARPARARPGRARGGRGAVRLGRGGGRGAPRGLARARGQRPDPRRQPRAFAAGGGGTRAGGLPPRGRGPARVGGRRGAHVPGHQLLAGVAAGRPAHLQRPVHHGFRAAGRDRRRAA